jgi:hypothetical protein
VKITAEHAEAESKGTWEHVEKRLFLNRIALKRSNVARWYPERAPVVKSDSANSDAAIADDAAVATGHTDDFIPGAVLAEFGCCGAGVAGKGLGER